MSGLTDDEVRELTCDCAESMTDMDQCPYHGGNDEMWVDVPARAIQLRVEAIIDARVAAERERLLAHLHICECPPESVTVAAAVRAERERLLARIEALHKPFGIWDECEHEHTDEDVAAGRAHDIKEVGYTCAHMYDVCQGCCTDDGYPSEECAIYHEHRAGVAICATAALVAEERAR